MRTSLKTGKARVFSPRLGWKVPAGIAAGYVLLQSAAKVVALGAVPENRRPGSAAAWLLLIFFAPAVGVPAFLLLGSPYVRGRRERIQGEMNRLILEQTGASRALPAVTTEAPAFASIVEQNRRLASLPAVNGRTERLYADSVESIRAMAAAVDEAQYDVVSSSTSWRGTKPPTFSSLHSFVQCVEASRFVC